MSLTPFHAMTISKIGAAAAKIHGAATKAFGQRWMQRLKA
jgi:hypothetical protein